MKILAVEFSTERRSVALWDSLADRLAGRAHEIGGRNTRAFALIDAALKQANWAKEEIERIVVGTGPGSYTGIRAAIALAQGWQLARNITVFGVSSAEILVEGALRDGLRGELDVVIDAQRNEFYLATFALTESSVVCSEELKIVAKDEIEQRARANRRMIGPFAETNSLGIEGRFPEAEDAGRLAAHRGEAIEAEKLEPIYLRETSFVKAPVPRIIPS